MVCRILLTVCSIVFLNVLSMSRGFSTGAPSSVCESMMPRHSGVLPQSNTAPYTIETGTSTYQPGIPIQGKQYVTRMNGLVTNGWNVGFKYWGRNIVASYWKLEKIEAPLHWDAGKTHPTPNCFSMAPKNNSTFVWIPPESACPDAVTFTATVAQSREIYWLNVQSPSLTKGIACCAVKMVYAISIITTLFLCSFLITGCDN